MNKRKVYSGISKAFRSSDIPKDFQSELLSFMINLFTNKVYTLTEKDKNHFSQYKSCYGKWDYPNVWTQIYNLYMDNVKKDGDEAKFFGQLKKYYFKFHHLKERLLI